MSHDGHPYAKSTPDKRPPNLTVIEAPTLRECVGVFENQTGWSITGVTSCCGYDFAIHPFEEEPAEWENPAYAHQYRKKQPLSEYNPTYYRAQELSPEQVILDDERWETFCGRFYWIVEDYGFDNEGKPLEAEHGKDGTVLP